MHLKLRAYLNRMLQDCWRLPLLTQLLSFDEMMVSQLVPLFSRGAINSVTHGHAIAKNGTNSGLDGCAIGLHSQPEWQITFAAFLRRRNTCS